MGQWLRAQLSTEKALLPHPPPSLLRFILEDVWEASLPMFHLPVELVPLFLAQRVLGGPKRVNRSRGVWPIRGWGRGGESGMALGTWGLYP